MECFIQKSRLQAFLISINQYINANQHIFKNQLVLRQRGDEPPALKLTQSHKNIPMGNFYFENNDYSGQLLDIIDLSINANYQIAMKGLYPLFVVRKLCDEYVAKNNVILFHTIESILAATIKDRLRMIREKMQDRNGNAKGFLIRDDIKEVLKFINTENPLTPNNKIKIMERLVYIGLNKKGNGELINNGSQFFEEGLEDKNPHKDKVIANALKDNCDYEEFLEFVNKYNIAMGANSEQSMIKKTFVVFSPELCKAKAEFNDPRLVPYNNLDEAGYRSVCFKVDPATKFIVNIFGANGKKAYSREKSMIANDSAEYSNNDKNKYSL